MCHRRSWPLYAVRGGLGEVRQRYVETWPLAGIRHRRQPATIRRRCLPCIYLLCVALRRATTPSPEAFRATRIWRDGVLRPVSMHRGRRPGSADGVTLSDGEGQGERAEPPMRGRCAMQRDGKCRAELGFVRSLGGRGPSSLVLLAGSQAVADGAGWPAGEGRGRRAGAASACAQGTSRCFGDVRRAPGVWVPVSRWFPAVATASRWVSAEPAEDAWSNWPASSRWRTCATRSASAC